MKKLFLIFFLPVIIYCQVIAPTQVNVLRGDKQTLTFQYNGNFITPTNYLITFVVKASSDSLTYDRLIEKTSLSGKIVKTYSNNKTIFTVTLDKEDTQDLRAKIYYYDMVATTVSDTTYYKTLARGNFNIIGDVQTPYDGTDLPSAAARYIPILATNFDNGEFIKSTGTSFVGDSLLAYLTWSDTTSSIPTKTFLSQNHYTKSQSNTLLGTKLDTTLATSTLRTGWSLAKTRTDLMVQDTTAWNLAVTRAALMVADTTNWHTAYSHVSLTNNPHSVTASQVGLGNVTNESKATMFTSPTFTGTVTIPTPFTLGAVSVSTTGTQLNYLNGATGTTGTTTTNLVFSTSPTLVTPTLGVAVGTSLALGGQAISTHALALAGTSYFNGNLGIGTAPDNSYALKVNSGASYAITLGLKTKSATDATLGLVITDVNDADLFAVLGDGTTKWLNAGVERMRLTSSGSLLVGYTADPTSGNKFAVNGTSYFSGNATFAGSILASAGSAASPSYAFSSFTNYGFYHSGGSAVRLSIAGTLRHTWTQDGYGILNDAGYISLGSTADIIMIRDAANTLALRNSTNAQTFNWYGSYTDASNYVGGYLGSAASSITLGTRTLGTGADNVDINISPSGTGVLNIGGNILPGTDNTYYLGKNDDDTPFAYKGLILKDTTNGKYYRIETISGVITATDLTD